MEKNTIASDIKDHTLNFKFNVANESYYAYPNMARKLEHRKSNFCATK